MISSSSSSRRRRQQQFVLVDTRRIVIATIISIVMFSNQLLSASSSSSPIGFNQVGDTIFGVPGFNSSSVLNVTEILNNNNNNKPSSSDSASTSSVEFGYSVILSNDGSRLAIGVPNHDWIVPTRPYYHYDDDNHGGPNDLVREGCGGVYVYNYSNETNTWDFLWFISGITKNEHIGKYISLSNDGIKLAIRRRHRQDEGQGQEGVVEVYNIFDDGTSELVSGSPVVSSTAANNTKNIRGANNNTKEEEEECINGGNTVTLSPDGNRLAISCESYDNYRGRVDIIEYNNFNDDNDDSSSWFHIGTLYGNNQQDRFGWSTSFSSTNGSSNRLAISSPNYNNKRGLVRVFDYDYDNYNNKNNNNNNNWVQVGSDLVGAMSNDRFGFSMEMSHDGLSIVVGSPASSDSGSLFGKVSVFTYKETTTDDGSNTWTLQGNEIEGMTTKNKFGRSVTISNNGKRIAASSHMYNQQRGHVRVFEFHDASQQWLSVGSDIQGLSKNSRLGYGLKGVSISGDGHRIATGSVNSMDDDGFVTGSVRVFDVNEEDATATSNNNFGYCGFPIDAITSGDPYVEPYEECNADATNKDDCIASPPFVKMYECYWQNNRCTSQLDLTGEDTKCPPIVDEYFCTNKNPWIKSRLCVWYEFTNNMPTLSPSSSAQPSATFQPTTTQKSSTTSPTTNEPSKPSSPNSSTVKPTKRPTPQPSTPRPTIRPTSPTTNPVTTPVPRQSPSSSPTFVQPEDSSKNPTKRPVLNDVLRPVPRPPTNVVGTTAPSLLVQSSDTPTAQDNKIFTDKPTLAPSNSPQTTPPTLSPPTTAPPTTTSISDARPSVDEEGDMQFPVSGESNRQSLVQVCQCDTSHRECISDAIDSKKRSVYLCLSLVSDLPKGLDVKFEEIFELKLEQDDFEDYPIKLSTRDQDTLRTREEKHAVIRTVLDEEFFKFKPSKVLARGIAILDIKDKNGNRYLIEDKLSSGKYSDDYSGDFSLELNLEGYDTFDEDIDDKFPWTWGGLVVVLLIISFLGCMCCYSCSAVARNNEKKLAGASSAGHHHGAARQQQPQQNVQGGSKNTIVLHYA